VGVQNNDQEASEFLQACHVNPLFMCFSSRLKGNHISEASEQSSVFFILNLERCAMVGAEGPVGVYIGTHCSPWEAEE
jgi:hypothetical protein